MTHKLLERVKARTNIPYSKLDIVYTEYFKTVKQLFVEGLCPAVVLTGLISFQFSASSLKYKCIKLTECIVEENLDALSKRFKVFSINEARKLLSELITIYKMKKSFDNQNILSKRRNYNGWER